MRDRSPAEARARREVAAGSKPKLVQGCVIAEPAGGDDGHAVRALPAGSSAVAEQQAGGKRREEFLGGGELSRRSVSTYGSSKVSARKRSIASSVRPSAATTASSKLLPSLSIERTRVAAVASSRPDCCILSSTFSTPDNSRVNANVRSLPWAGRHSV